MKDLNLDNAVREMLGCFENDCIIVDKVFASCQQRECFPKIEVDLDGKTFESIRFKPGFIVPGTLVVTDIENRPNFRRVRFTLRIPFEIKTKDGKIIPGFLPDILKDIILFIPDARDEFEFRIVVETSSLVLGQPIQTGKILTFAVGVFIVVKVVGTVQLLIPTFGYCPEPDPCEEFSPEDICDDFDYSPFPEFFPPQFDDIIWD
ncbi:hypothetical protein [Clostridium sp. Cult2]|uniref:hypothetical protein n=1 Tax=Clostridium sp. Cult2 TaxID=2079003 RepID=UPI001F3FA56B|nr:hypothetical protein [Clostridium sp. Cult2]MCF6465671.1 hypothetical protein [Clostridium sp. Cult2]